MEPPSGVKSFLVAADTYDRFMGRYSRPLAGLFASFAGVGEGGRALDVGCGPGALTHELVGRLGARSVCACDPSPPFVAACRERNPGVDVRQGAVEQLPFDDDAFDFVVAQLVMHFVSDPEAAAREMERVGRPGCTIAACVWDFEQGMQMLRAFWDAALSVDAEAPDELRVMRFGRDGELAQWLSAAGLTSVTETSLTVRSSYRDFDELWSGFEAGIGPAGSYTARMPPDHWQALRQALFERLGSPTGPFTLDAVARAARGSVGE